MPLLWRHNDHDGASNHRRPDCLLNRLLRRRSNKTSKLRVPGLCEGNSPVTDEFPAQKAGNAEDVPIWWRHHANSFFRSFAGLVYGHTGHVRFLTCVEVPHLPSHVKPNSSPRPAGVQTPPTTSAAFSNRTRKVLVISGGDGYEDFRNKANSDSVGKDDSTNHLLLWQA